MLLLLRFLLPFLPPPFSFAEWLKPALLEDRYHHSSVSQIEFPCVNNHSYPSSHALRIALQKCSKRFKLESPPPPITSASHRLTLGDLLDGCRYPNPKRLDNITVCLSDMSIQDPAQVTRMAFLDAYNRLGKVGALHDIYYVTRSRDILIKSCNLCIHMPDRTQRCDIEGSQHPCSCSPSLPRDPSAPVKHSSRGIGTIGWRLIDLHSEC
jgi:hypothetical protein